MPYREFLSTPEEILEDARQGRMFILVDDEGRENEGDLIIPAQMATPDAVNFMAKHGRGLICLAMTAERCKELNLPLMSQQNNSRHMTAFTVSIEAKEGITTGISAADRARSVQVAIDPNARAEDIVSPGHVFPLVAREGGVLVRAGHTEAAVDVARMAGLLPAGVICEVMNDDGTMARMPDLVRFAQEHGLKVGTIADLIAYRRTKERLVRRELETDFHSTYGGDWRMMLYVSTVSYGEHIALVKGDLRGKEPVLVRMHALNVLDDVLGDSESGHAGQLHESMGEIARAGRGVVVLIREPSSTSLSDRLRTRITKGAQAQRLVDYGVGAQILLDLGVTDMVLLSNTPKNIIALDGYGLRVVSQKPISDEE